MARKSQTVAVLEAKLSLYKAAEERAKLEFEAANRTKVMLEDVLKSVRAASAGAKGGRVKNKRQTMPTDDGVASPSGLITSD